jgi:glycosyltransferase involved in cell wall biosynthesis
MQAPFNNSQDGALPRLNRSTPWVLVAAGFHQQGGMDKANLALGQYLVEQGTPVHAVCHTADADFAGHPLVTVHRVPLPAGSFFLGVPWLDYRGRWVARQITRRWPNARVLVNGDSCLWPAINWVHYVHHAWTPNFDEGPLWFRTKQTLAYHMIRRRERSAARLGRIFITNSHRTSQDMVQRLHVPRERVHTVYLGAESEWGPVTAEEKTAAREALGVAPGRMVAAFVGALGFENRKGFDVLFDGWKTLCADPQWDVDLLVAGSGNALPMWRQRVSESGLSDRIRLVGFREQVRDFLAVADLLVSPARYEAYGLNAQEAICRGVPAIVSEQAGVAERYGTECQPLLLRDPEDPQELMATIRLWRLNPEAWRARFKQFGDSLRAYGWRDMAAQMVSIAGRTDMTKGGTMPDSRHVSRSAVGNARSL